MPAALHNQRDKQKFPRSLAQNSPRGGSRVMGDFGQLLEIGEDENGVTPRSLVL